jgi:tripartite ATP-independent transporter DctM subunit
VIGGILAGVFTPTEAAGVAVLYALALGRAHRELDWQALPGILTSSATTTGVVGLLIGASSAFAWVLAYARAPQAAAELLLAISDDPTVVLLLINLALLAAGTVLDMTPAVLVFTPIFLPVVTALGYDPVHFGIVMILNLCIGLCTPPVGSVLFVGCSTSGARLESVVKPLLPLFAAMLLALAAVTLLPELSLALPRALGY